MNDTISRQAAIDIVTPHDDNRVMRDALEELPPAQPEIIRCKDCEWWTKQDDSLQGRCALLGMYPTGDWFCGNAKRRVTE